MITHLVQLEVDGPWLEAVAMDDNMSWFNVTGHGARHRSEIFARRVA